jgi:hypothetical protein
MIFIGPSEPAIELIQARLHALEGIDPEGDKELTALSTNSDPSLTPMARCQAVYQIVQRRYFYDRAKMQRKRGDYCDAPSDALGRLEVIQTAVMTAMGDFDLRPIASRVQAPTLIVEGVQSPVPVQGDQEWARSLLDASVRRGALSTYVRSVLKRAA